MEISFNGKRKSETVKGKQRIRYTRPNFQQMWKIPNIYMWVFTVY